MPSSPFRVSSRFVLKSPNSNLTGPGALVSEYQGDFCIVALDPIGDEKLKRDLFPDEADFLRDDGSNGLRSLRPARRGEP